MRPSVVALILALAALAIVFLVTSVNAYTPRYSPSEIAVDAAGNVYTIMDIGCFAGEGIFVYGPDGSEIKSISRPGCSDIVIDGNGTVYVSCLPEKRLERLVKDDIFSIVWQEQAPGRFINYIAAGPDNNILVSNYNYSAQEVRVTEGCILKITPEGKIAGIINSSPEIPLEKYYRMTVSSNGTIYLTNFTRCISVIYPDGNRSLITHTSPDNGTFSQVQTVEIGADGYLYIGETSNGRVRKLATNGTLIAQWDGCGPDRFVSPVSIAATRDGRVYVSDMMNQRIVWFDGNRYYFGMNASDNMAGKGVLWDSVISGDNYTAMWQIIYNETAPGNSIPGFDAPVGLAGLSIACLLLVIGRIRKD